MSDLLPFGFSSEPMWIDTDGRYRLAIMPRPPGGAELDAHIGALRAAGVDVVVSMLEAEEAEWMDLGGESDACARNRVRFLSFPIPDHSVPESREDALAFARELKDLLDAGSGVAIHCYAGIGRSALMAITALYVAGFELGDAVARASEARGFAVPEANQLEWLAGFVAGNG